jgi:hypothetical protein
MKGLCVLLVAVACGQYFKPAVRVTVGQQPALVAACDFSHDGRTDFVVANLGSESLGVQCATAAAARAQLFFSPQVGV